HVFQSTDHLFDNFSVQAEGEPVGWLGDPGYVTEGAVMRPLSYVRARWYQAGGPGWLSKDPLASNAQVGQFPAGISDFDESPDEGAYHYAANSPLVYRDPTGLAAASSPGCLAVPIISPAIGCAKCAVAIHAQYTETYQHYCTHKYAHCVLCC